MSSNLNTLAAPSSITPAVPYPTWPAVTPEMFGAKKDGTTDDTTAFQSALTYLTNNGGGVLTLGFGIYGIRTGNITIPEGVFIVGQAPPMGQFINGLTVGHGTVIMDYSNNNTFIMANLNSGIRNVVFATPQPIFQAGSINSNGTLSTISARWAGYGLTAGTYNLSITGGYGSSAAGTCVVGSGGQVTSCTVTNAGSGYYTAGPLGSPLITATITGGNQTGAFISLAGADFWAIEDCAFIGKQFGVLINGSNVVLQSTSQMSSSSNQISFASTAALAPGMVLYSPTSPQSILLNNSIASISGNVVMTFNFDATSPNLTDTIVAGQAVYFVKGQIKRCAFWGSTIMQLYANVACENFDVHDCFFGNAGNGAVFFNNALNCTFERNNIDGIYAPLANAFHGLNKPSSFRDNNIGNITGNSTSVSKAVQLGGKTLSGGPTSASNTLISGNQIYAPCPIGFNLSYITNCVFESNLVGVTGLSGNYGLITDSHTVGNVFDYGADVGPGGTPKWSLASQRNWFKGPAGWMRPYRKVTTTVTLDQYDCDVCYDGSAGIFTITLPSEASLTNVSNGTGLNYTLICAGSGNVVSLASTANINGSGSALALSTTAGVRTGVSRDTTTQWWAG